jgi:DNA-directed RNA polymerase subunit F
MKEFGITQTETSKLNDKGEQVIELRYGFDTKTINTLTDKQFTSLMRNNRSLLTQVMEQSDLADIEKLEISAKRKAEIKAEFWNELTGTTEKMEKAKLVAPSSDINELYDIRTALMDNKEAIELTYAKQLKEGKDVTETLKSVKRAREAVNNVDALIEIKKTQIEKATTPIVEIEQIKETLKPGKATPKEAATNAITQLKKGNIEDAAKAIAESSTHKQTVLLAGKNANTYADTSITKILRMANEGAPETLVNQMAKERSQYALETLSKKNNEMKKAAFKISEGMPLNSDELKTLWKPENRELAFDAMWHEKNPTSLTDELVKDALTRNNADELAQLKKEMQEELTACINRGECI